jgi:hypothetical protein
MAEIGVNFIPGSPLLKVASKSGSQMVAQEAVRFLKMYRNMRKAVPEGVLQKYGLEYAPTNPATPIGHRGKNIKVPDGTNSPAKIGDRQYSGHALDSRL